MTTVGSVYALAQFIPNGSGAGIYGGSNFNPQTGSGFTNAFNEVPNMIDIFTGTAYTQTVNGLGYVPQAEINTLANILAPCVNSASTASTDCNALFTAATPSSGTPPSTVLGAALDIALNPGNNVSALYNLSTANAPFQSALTVAPNDWTVAVAYDVSANHPQGLAIDSNGNAWMTAWVSENPAKAEIVMISPIGVPASNNPYASTTNLSGSAGIAVDLDGVVWVANSTNASAMSVWLVSNQINARFGPFFPPSMPNPLQVLADVGGSLWFTASGNNTVVDFVPNPNYETAVTYNTFSGGGMNDPTGIAMYYVPTNFNTFPFTPAFYDVWVANHGADSATEIIPGTTTGTNYTGGGITNSVGAAVDHSGNIWMTNPSTNSVSELNSSGGTVSPTGGWTGGGLDGPSGIAIDGNGNFWIANATNSSVTELNGSTGAPLTPSTGYLSASLQTPSQIAVDASGNVWAINTNEVTTLVGHETVTEFLGLAAPVNVPLVQAMILNQVGQRPH